MGTEAPLLEALGGRSELEAEAGGELALGCGAAIPCPPLRPGALGHRHVPVPEEGRGVTGAGEQWGAPDGPHRGKKVTVCNGISSLAAAELAGRTLHKKRLQSMESGGRVH